MSMSSQIIPKMYQSRVQVVPNHLKAVPELTEPEDIPASQVVDDFHERLLPVRGDVVEGLAAFIKVLHLIKKMRMVMMMMAAIMGLMTIVIVVTFHSIELY